jgi:hypothetical protein
VTVGVVAGAVNSAKFKVIVKSAHFLLVNEVLVSVKVPQAGNELTVTVKSQSLNVKPEGVPVTAH